MNAKEIIAKSDECNLHADGLLKLVAVAMLGITQNSLQMSYDAKYLIIGVFDVGELLTAFCEFVDADTRACL